MTLKYNEAAGTVKVVLSSDKGADKDDPSIKVQKEKNGDEKIYYRNRAVADAVTSEKYGAITFKAEAGTKVTVYSEPVSGYRIAEYSVTIDDGGKEDLPFDGENSETHIKWKHHVEEDEKTVLQIEMEKIPEEKEEEQPEDVNADSTENPAETATEEPAVAATEEPAVAATEEPAAAATEEPAAAATEEPAVAATEEPAAAATEEPAAAATEEPAAAATEEPAAEDPDAESKTGNIAFDFGNADVSAEVFISGNGTPSITYDKEVGKNGKATIGDNSEGSVFTRDGDMITASLETGTEVRVVAKTKEGFRISEYSATVNGEKEVLPLDKNDPEGRIEWTYSVGEGMAVFNLKTETAVPEETVPACTLSVKLDSEGGTVKVTDNDKMAVSLKKENGEVRIIGSEDSLAPVVEKDGTVIVATGEPGKKYTISAEAEDKHQITIFSVTDPHGNVKDVKERGFFEKLFNKDAHTCTAALAEGTTVVEVSFINMPAFSAWQKIGKVTVKVDAEEGVFPEGTTVEIREMQGADAQAYVDKAKAMSENPDDANPVLAVDITFKDREGHEIHPAGNVAVTFMNAAEEADIMNVYHAVNADASQMESLETTVNGKDVGFTSGNFSPIVLMASSGTNMPNPGNDLGTFKGNEPTPSLTNVTNKRLIEYGSAGYEVKGDRLINHTNPIDIKDSNGRTAVALCLDPNGGGFKPGESHSHVEAITSKNMIKALYYGMYGFGTNYAKEIAGSADGGTVLAHLAAAYYAWGNSLGHGNSMMEHSGGHASAAKTWQAMNSKLKQDINAYMSKVESLPTPSGVSGFLVYPKSGYDMGGVQYYAYLVVDRNGFAHVQKSSANPPISDGNSNYSLKNGVFWVYDTEAHANAAVKSGSKTGRLATLTTGTTGSTEKVELAIGTYYMVEGTAPTGYRLPDDSARVKKFTITSANTSANSLRVDFKDTPKVGSVVVHKASSDPALSSGNSYYSLEGATFQIFDTSAHAQARIDGSGSTAGRISGVKTDRKTKITTLTTDKNGITEIMMVYPGTYYMVELKAPKGYTLPAKASDRIKKFTVKDTGTTTTTTVDFEDGPEPGYLSVQKTGTMASITSGNSYYSLEGAEFQVYDTKAHANARIDSGSIDGCVTLIKHDGTKAKTLATDASGKTETVKLVPGTYYVVEIKAPKGYALPAKADRIKKVTVTKDTTEKAPLKTTFKDAPKLFSVYVLKKSANPSLTNGNEDYSLKGAQFQLYDTKAHALARAKNGSTEGVVTGVDEENKSAKTLHTDETGKTQTLRYPPDIYYMVEVKAPKNFKLPEDPEDRVQKITLTVSYTEEKPLQATFTDEPTTSQGAYVIKTSANPALTKSNDCYSLENGVFWVFDTEAHAKAGVESGSTTGRLAVLKTDEDGETDICSLDPGKFYMAEIKAPQGFMLPAKTVDRIKAFNVAANKTTKVKYADEPGFDPITVEIEKNSAYPTEKPRTLAGTEFEVKYYDGYYTASNIPDDATRTWIMETKDINGRYMAGTQIDISGDALYKVGDHTGFPLGTITITEKEAAEGYVNDGKFGGADMYICQFVMNKEGTAVQRKEIQGTTTTSNTAKLTFNVSDTPVFGGFKALKVDAGTMAPTESLEGAVFELINENEYDVAVKGGKTFKKGAVVGTYTVGKDGVIEAAKDSLQTGTYSLHETKAPAGYTINSESYPVVIKEGAQEEIGIEITPVNGFTKGIPNTSVRGDIKFLKVDAGTQSPMAGVQFKITSAGTGENHIVTTDENGVFDSAAVKHSANTNGGGAADGLWFGDTEVDDNKGAFYCGKYHMEEIPGENNKGYEMISTDFEVKEGKESLDLGTIENEKMIEFRTELLDADGEHEAMAEGTIDVTDTVHYAKAGKYIGNSITAEGSIVDKETGKVLDKTTVNVNINEEEGSFDMSFTLDVTSFEGKEIVAYQTISDNEGNVIATLNDPLDKDETIRFPRIATTAADKNSGTQTAKADETITIEDKVSYENLASGKDYVMTGTLMDKETGEPLKDAEGNTVTSSQEFTASKSGNGNVTVTFTFKAGKDYEGKTLVAFEKLLGKGIDKVYAIHEDMDDENQTVNIPRIRTSVKDDATGIRSTAAEKAVSVTDTVTYEKLIVGETYTLKGTLVLKEDGSEIASAEKIFLANKENGAIDLTFTFDASSLGGKDIVAFEELYAGDSIIAEHKDLNDEGQTIHVPGGRTTAADSETKMQNSRADGESTIVDIFYYENLIPGTAYKVAGKVMDKETGEEIPSTMVSKDGSPLEGGAYTFTPTEKDGSITLYFKIDASALAGEDAVMFEKVTHNDKEVIVHEDLEDEPQTIHFPDGGTTAIDTKTGIKNALAEEGTLIKDTFGYKNLIPGTAYKVTGSVMDKESGKEIQSVMTDKDGNPIGNGFFELVPEEKDGSFDLYFLINAKDLGNKDAVVFERVSVNGAYVIIHEDLDDEAQTMHIPEGRTAARDSETNEQLSFADKEITVIDTFMYWNLIPGTEYTVTGRVMNKQTGEEISSRITDAEGEAQSLAFDAEKVTFTPSAKDGELEISFTFDGSALAGNDVVVFERAYHQDVPVIIHENIDDEAQTVHIPEGRTTAADSETKMQNSKADGESTIVDIFYYENLIPGKTYKVAGKVMDKETGEEIPSAAVTEDGSEIEAGCVEFTPEEKDGSITLYFRIDASALAGKDAVMFEKVTYNGKEIIVHEDLEDEPQTIHYPEGKTTAIDTKTGIKNVLAEEGALIKDTFEYKNLIPGNTYRITGQVMDKESGEEIQAVMADKDGNPLENGYLEIVPEEKDGSIDLYFLINAKDLGNKDAVVFERVSVNGAYVIIHEDLGDEKQTVYIPEGRTTARDSETEDQISLADKEITVIDTFIYKNLIPGTEYTVTGRVMNKQTGEEISSRITDAEGEAQSLAFDAEKVTFTPSAKDGELEISFTFDGSALAGNDVVVFERAYHQDVPVIIHENIDDEAQTVHIPEGRTTAADSETKMQNSKADGESTIVDIFYYENLIPGKTYKVAGKVMDKETGEEIPSAAVTEDGSEIEAGCVEFTPEEKDGSITLYFRIDASALAGKDAVVFEDVTFNDKEVIIHEDLKDEPQTIHYPEGKTTAIDTKTGIKNVLAEKNALVKDTFEYKNLIPGTEYTVTGQVMNKETGEEIPSVMTDKDGNPMENGSFKLIPGEKDGSVELYFLIDAKDLGNKDAVVFERVSVNGAYVIIHENLEDEDQTTHIPEGRTTAKDSETQVQLSLADNEVTIIDTFIYQNLIPGTEYTVTGRVMNKQTGEEISSRITGAGGEAQSLAFDAEKVTFIPSVKDGELEISFTFDGSTLAGTDAVVFERAYHDGVPVIIHENIDDEAQTDHIPDGRTTAVDKENGSHTVKAEDSITIKDTFIYKNLLPGKEYSVTGKIMDKATGKEVKSTMVDANGKAIEKFTFTASKKNGSVELYFKVNTAALKGRDLVTFEKVQFEGKDVIIHENIEDEEQTVHVPEGRTTALDSETNDHISHADSSVTINDEFFYKNLVPGQKYTIKGTLMDKETKKALIADGKEVTVERSFVPKEKDGSIIITFKFNGSALKGKTAVAFETVYVNGKEVLVHADLEDEDQTVHFPDGRTTALDSETKSHNSLAGNKVTINDEFFYKNLVPGKKYTVKGVLMDKATGKPLAAGGKEVTGEVTFTPEEKDGSVIISFTFDGSALEGKTTVAFETLYVGNKEVLVHADLKDEDQTVHFPSVRTTATDKKDGDHTLATSGTVTITDRVVCRNLDAGKTYKVAGRLMDKATGKEVTVNGKPLEVESKPFVAKSSNGSIDIHLTFNVDNLKSADYVMFERLYEIVTDKGFGNGKKEALVGRHEDIKDAAQTVTVPKRPKKTSSHGGGSTTRRRVQTGEFPVMPIAGAGAVAALAIGIYLVLRSRKKKD